MNLAFFYVLRYYVLFLAMNIIFVYKFHEYLRLMPRLTKEKIPWYLFKTFKTLCLSSSTKRGN